MVRRRVYADSESEYIKDLGRKLSDQTERILKSEEEWKRFLRTAARFIHYPFHNQILIYAEKPESLGVATYEVWNQRCGMGINGGTHGVKVFENMDADKLKVITMHDRSDLHVRRRGAKLPPIWEFPVQDVENIVDRICGESQEQEKRPEKRLWDWIGSQITESDAQTVFEKCKVKEKYLDKDLDMHSDGISDTEYVKNFMHATVAYEVFSRCNLNLDFCDERNAELLQENPYNLRGLFTSDEEAIGYLGDEISKSAQGVFGVIRARIKEYERDLSLNQKMEHVRQIQKEKNAQVHQEDLPQKVVQQEIQEEKTEPESASEQERQTEVQPEVKEKPQEVAQSDQTEGIEKESDYQITDGHLGEGGPKEKYHWNIQAIKTLHTIEQERRSATEAEKDILAKYVGWGGLSEAFDSTKVNWSQEYQELKSVLTDEEYRAARSSTLNAHYTSPMLIKGIYQALENMGFSGGNILEPSCGIGNFFGMMPESIKNEKSRLFGVELDDVSGRIAKVLYPNANIQVNGFENVKYPNNFFDVVVGNVPFGDYTVNDPAYNKHHFMIHDYFIAKGLDQLRPGGVMAVITSAGTMDKKNQDARKYFADRAELLGAIRLPNTAFKANAGTEVMTDILFFQKSDHADPAPKWCESKKTIGDDDPWMVGDKVVYHERIWNRETRSIESKEFYAEIAEIRKSSYGNQETYYRVKDLETGKISDSYGKVDLRLAERGKPVYTCNQYFQEHPEMVLGKLELASGPFGERIICRENPLISLEAQLEQAIRRIQGHIQEVQMEELIQGKEHADTVSIPALPEVKNYSFAVVDGDIYYRQDSLMEKQTVSEQEKERLLELIQLKNAGYQLLNMELEDQPQEQIQERMKELNQLYDQFVEKYGRIQAKENRIFDKDASSGFVKAFEHYDEKGKFLGKADIFTKRTVNPHIEVEQVKSAQEALVVSLVEKGTIDIRYMAGLLEENTSEQMVVENLKGLIYRDPSKIHDKDPYSGYVTADEYLSGDIREKLDKAKQMAEVDDSYQEQVAALTVAMPKPLDASEIDVRLGATWVKPEYIQQFIEETFKVPAYYMGKNNVAQKDHISVQYSPLTAEWHIDNKGLGNDLMIPLATTRFGSKRKNGLEILENLLNLRDSKVYDQVTENGTRVSVFNRKETALCSAKAEVIKQEFESWIFKDPKRRKDLVDTYNARFNNRRQRSFDGSFLTFPGMNPDIQLRKHQKDAIARALYGGNELLAHVVGAGKTYTMAAIAMESKRIGITHKSLFVVPNHLTEQWGKEFRELYPAANILVATKEDFTPARRKTFCAKIATGDYDAVIIGHSQAEKIPLSEKRQSYYIKRQIQEVSKAIQDAKNQNGEKFSIKQLEKMEKKLQVKLDKLASASKKDDVVTFEQLGVDRLFVDESHYYKNMFLYTKMKNVSGVQQTEAAKSSDMYMKCQYMDELTNGKGIVFATGTPLSNSMVELYTNMRYLQSDLLKKYGLDQFDAWAANFGNVVTTVELAPEGVGYRAKKRFSSFFNLPELMGMWHEAADVQTADMLDLPVPKATIYNVKTQPTQLQRDMVLSLADRADMIRNRQVEPNVDNMLKVTNDGRKLALDQRLINPDMPDIPNSKVNSCVDISYAIWEKTKGQQSAQLIFCDLSTPKGDGSFSVYEDIRSKLIKKGVPEQEIAFIHEAKTEGQKDRLFSKVRQGEIRFLIGSTTKMGAGTNVQDHLIALHHLDVPWRPSDIEQREGRIVRQGNKNPEVQIYRYVTSDTFDAYNWQVIEGKQKFISQIMTSSSPVRKCSDIDEAALSYAEVKALATGNPYIKEKMELDVSVSKMKLERAAHESEIFRLQDNVEIRYPKRIETLERLASGLKADQEQFADAKVLEMKIGEKTYTNLKEAGDALKQTVGEVCTKPGQQVCIGEYRNFPIFAEKKEGDLEGYWMYLQGKQSYQFEMHANGASNFGVMQKLLGSIEKRLENAEQEMEKLRFSLKAERAEMNRPYEKEDLYRQQLSRLKELEAQLSISEDADSELAVDVDETAVTSQKPEPTTWGEFVSYDPKKHPEYLEDQLPQVEIIEAENQRKEIAGKKEEQIQPELKKPTLEEKSHEKEESLVSEQIEAPKYMEGSEKPENLKKYDLQFTGIGNGVTVWNKAMPIYEEPRDLKHKVKDYETIAYISPDGKNTTYFFEKEQLPSEVIRKIEDTAGQQAELYRPEEKELYTLPVAKDLRNLKDDILQNPEAGMPVTYQYRLETIHRNAGGIDMGDLYSAGLSESMSAFQMFLEYGSGTSGKENLYAVGLDQYGTERVYLINERQLNRAARQELMQDQGVKDTLLEPIVTIKWSESSAFRDGETLSLRVAENLFAAYDEGQRILRETDENLPVGYYHKTAFAIVTDDGKELSRYEGRYDLGDGDGGLLEHIYGVQTAYLQDKGLYAAYVSQYGKENADQRILEKENFISETLPTWQTYLRYVIVPSTREKGLWEISDMYKFQEKTGLFGANLEDEEHKPISFDTVKEAKEYLEQRLSGTELHMKKHLVQTKTIELAKQMYIRRELNHLLESAPNDADYDLQDIALRLGYVQKTTGVGRFEALRKSTFGMEFEDKAYGFELTEDGYRVITLSKEDSKVSLSEVDSEDPVNIYEAASDYLKKEERPVSEALKALDENDVVKMKQNIPDDAYAKEKLPKDLDLKQCTYIKNGVIMADRISFEEALARLISDRAVEDQRGKYQIDGKSGESTVCMVKGSQEGGVVALVSEVATKVDMAVDSLYRKKMAGVLQKASEYVHIQDPYNYLDMPFKEYQKHEQDNVWKNPRSIYADEQTGFRLTEKQERNLQTLIYAAGCYLKPDDVKDISNGKMPGGKRGEVTEDIKKIAKEFKENVIDIWEDCQKKQEQIVEVKTITKAEVKLSR